MFPLKFEPPGVGCYDLSIRTLNSRETLDLLRRYESRNVTYLAPDGSWPIVWQEARGVHVRDSDGKRYLDLTSAFGVAAAGHTNRNVVQAGRVQMQRLLHAMGDVHPHAGKALLARKLSEITFERWSKLPGSASSASTRSSKQGTASRRSKTIFCNSGFEAVEAALKTAMLATGKPGIIAFEGGYHGLGYGALNATHREHFSSHFALQLKRFASFAPFPSTCADASADETALAKLEAQLHAIFHKRPIGAILVEPVQVRGGINIPPPGFLRLLRRVCDEHQALLVLDEIYTGFGRTGKWFACEHDQVRPDVVCLGKALTGGFPLSACVGESEVMDRAWPPSTGEAIHTSTFLGHPVGCAMALAQIAEIERLQLVDCSAELGTFLLEKLKAAFAPDTAGHCSRQEAPQNRNLRGAVRGLGLLAGVELMLADGSPATQAALNAITEMLSRGFILLPEGEHSNIISFTPPLVITQRQLSKAVSMLEQVVTRRVPSVRRGNLSHKSSPTTFAK